MSSVSINNLVLMGRLTADPELRRSKNNNAVTSFRLAVTRRNNAEVTDFIPCVAFGGLGEFVQQWFQKGTLAIVIGQLTARVWQDKDGNTRTSYEVQCDNIQFGETKKQRVARELDEPAADSQPERSASQPTSAAPAQIEPDSRSGLQIVALDSVTGTVLENAVYDIYTPDGEPVQQKITTGTDGIASVVGLTAGEYIITEVTTPDSFRPVVRSVSVRLEPGVNHSINFPHNAAPVYEQHPAYGGEQQTDFIDAGSDEFF